MLLLQKKDAFHGPKVSGIITQSYAGRKGNIIFIQARDNFKVTTVRVSIYNEKDKLIEEGDAVDNVGVYGSFIDAINNM